MHPHTGMIREPRRWHCAPPGGPGSSPSSQTSPGRGRPGHETGSPDTNSAGNPPDWRQCDPRNRSLDPKVTLAGQGTWRTVNRDSVRRVAPVLLPVRDRWERPFRRAATAKPITINETDRVVWISPACRLFIYNSITDKIIVGLHVYYSAFAGKYTVLPFWHIPGIDGTNNNNKIRWYFMNLWAKKVTWDNFKMFQQHFNIIRRLKLSNIWNDNIEIKCFLLTKLYYNLPKNIIYK